MKFKKILVIVILLGGILSLECWKAQHSFAQSLEADTTQAHSETEATNHHEVEHGDPYAVVFRALALLILCAVVGHYLSQLTGQSPVLGELLIGMVVGSILYQIGDPGLTIIRHNDEIIRTVEKVVQTNLTWDEAIQADLKAQDYDQATESKLFVVLSNPNFLQYLLLAKSILFLSSFGVILLLFIVGLESSMEEMRQAGGISLAVALIGIAAPFLLGYLATGWLMPELEDSNVAIFVGASLCATSIGITARVFKDMNQLQIPEAKIVLGAAVIDDVLGLIVLAIVSGIITTGSVSILTISWILLKSVLFLGLVLFFGLNLLEKTIRFTDRLDHQNIRLLYPLALLTLLSWLADSIGLATIVGAFAAGLIIREEYFILNEGETVEEHIRDHSTVEAIVAPIEGIFAPVFFVVMGMQVDISAFTDLRVIGLGLVITLVAIVGKLVTSLIVPKPNHRWIIGIGMVPRGEVGLIFASIGKSLGVLNGELFSVIIIMVILTTLVTPPFLSWSLARKARAEEPAEYFLN